MKPRRPYVRVATDWCDNVLQQWAEQVRTRPRTTVVVTQGGAMPMNIIQGGNDPDDTVTGRGLTARGIASRQPGVSKEPMGYLVHGLSGVAATADRVVLHIAGVDSRCAWTLRAEYGLIPDIGEGDAKTKGLHLGTYLDGRAWPASAYADRLARGLSMFAVGYLCAFRN